MTTVQNAPLATIHGKFHVGMTLEEAKAQNLNLNLFNRIDKLDGNNNGRLSLEDITARRDIECSRKNNTGLVGCAAAIGAALTATPIGLIGAGIATICSMSLFIDSSKERTITDRYKD